LVGGIRFQAEQGGTIPLRINDQWLAHNSGALRVEVSVESPE
jgi:hypothetical protein